MGLQLSPVIAGGGSGSGGSGDVVGPASSTDNAIVRWDGLTGKLVKDSGVLIDNSNNITLPGTASIGTASADYWVFAGGTGSMTATATGSSTNISIGYIAKGNGTHTFNNQVFAPVGSAAAPGLAFGTDGATGLYASSANSIDVTIGGTRRFQLISSSLRGLAGAAAAPVYTFSGDPDTGPYSAGANQYGIATGGVVRTVTTDTGFDISLAGSETVPSLRINSTNSGFYAQATDGVAMSAAGAQIWRATSAGGLLMSRRFQLGKTGNVASATSITIGTAGNLVPITGSTTISRIVSTNWTDGSEIKLQLPSGITVEHLSASGSGAQVNLTGATDLTTTAVTYLHLLLDGGVWIEMYRRVMP